MNKETPKASPDELVVFKGITYKRLTDVPFTGLVEQKWDNGQLRLKGTYKDGKKDGFRSRFYPSGQPHRNYSYKNGKSHGVWESYRFYGGQIGQLSWISNHKNGMMHGVFESYHENGQLRIRYTYKNGKQDGVEELYDENGQLENRLTYKDGEIIKEEKF